MEPLEIPRNEPDDPFLKPPPSKSHLIKVGKNYVNPKYVSHIECFHNGSFNFIVYMISVVDNYSAEIHSYNYETEALRDKTLDDLVNRLPM